MNGFHAKFFHSEKAKKDQFWGQSGRPVGEERVALRMLGEELEETDAGAGGGG